MWKTWSDFLSIPFLFESKVIFCLFDLVSRMQKDMTEAEAYSYFPLYDIQAQSALKQELIDHIIVFENTPTQQEIEELNQAGSFDFSVKDFEMEEVTNYRCSVKVIPGRTCTFGFIFIQALINQI